MTDNDLVTFLPDSRPWYDEPRGWPDVLRCRLGRHRRITQAIHLGRATCRCSCGAFELDRDGLWVHLDAQSGRRP